MPHLFSRARCPLLIALGTRTSQSPRRPMCKGGMEIALSRKHIQTCMYESMLPGGVVHKGRFFPAKDFDLGLFSLHTHYVHPVFANVPLMQPAAPRSLLRKRSRAWVEAVGAGYHGRLAKARGPHALQAVHVSMTVILGPQICCCQRLTQKCQLHCKRRSRLVLPAATASKSFAREAAEALSKKVLQSSLSAFPFCTCCCLYLPVVEVVILKRHGLDQISRTIFRKTRTYVCRRSLSRLARHSPVRLRAPLACREEVWGKSS